MTAAGGGERLGEVLRVLRACGPGTEELDADQILDVLWLARRLPADAGAPLSPQPPPPRPQPAPPPA
ncbi:hypothetical protein ACVNF4_35475, partial [Streptomyces sp. S6]